MQPKKQLKAQYIGIFEEIDSFYLKRGPKNSGMGRPPPPQNSGNARKKTFFFIETFFLPLL